MTAIYKRELKSYFTTFLGPLFIGATLFLLGIYFSVYNLFMGYPYIGYAISSVVFLFLVSVPVLTMRILAEERRQKTDQLILTSPVGVGRIVLGKFLALATVFAIPVMIISLYPLVLAGFGTIAFGETYLAILGFFLYGLASIAIGIFVSSLTESQVIAAVLTFGILFLCYVMSGLCNMISPTGNFLTKILGAFDMAGRFEGLLDGSLQMTDIVYFLSVILLSLVFTVQSIQKRRYQISTGTVSMGAYSTAVLVISAGAVVLLNVLLAELPPKYTVFDLTASKLYSLTDETEEMVAALEEDVDIYVLANEKQADEVLDASLKNYAALNSHIKVSYVDPAVNPKFFTKYTDAMISANSVIVESQKRSRVIDYGEIYQKEFDYATYSQTVTGYDGEGQITSALAYVATDEMPKIYLLEGHGELSFEEEFLAAIEKANVGYETINLLNYSQVPEDAACVVIHGPTEDLSGDDTEKLLAYMEGGGNMLIVTAYSDRELTNFNRILDFYGVQATQGLLIERDANYYYQDPFYLLPDISYDTITEGVLNGGSYVFVPYARGLTVTEKEGAEGIALLSASEECFARSNTEIATYDKQEGDEEGPFVLGVASSRTVGEETSQAAIYSSEYIFTQNADEIVAGTNLKLFSGTIRSLVPTETAGVSIPVKNYNVSFLAMAQSSILLLTIITVIAIPSAFLVGGFLVWFGRRKR